MSLILDALNRSRDNAQKVPGLATSHFGENRPAAGGWRTRLLLVALVLALLLIAWLLWERTGPDKSTPPPAPAGMNRQGAASAPGAGAVAARRDPVPAPTESAQAPPTAQAPQASAPASPSVPPATAVSRVGPAAGGVAASSERGDSPAPASDEKAATSAASADSAPGPAPAPVSASVEALYRQQQLATPEVPVATAEPESPPEAAAIDEPAPVSVAREEQPVDIEQLLTAAQDELENARLAEHPAPFITALSQQTKDAIPTLMYQAHDYTGNKTDSYVLINGKKLKVGGSTGGVRVDEILPDSVVLSFKGTQFRLRALNSWVNL